MARRKLLIFAVCCFMFAVNVDAYYLQGLPPVNFCTPEVARNKTNADGKSYCESDIHLFVNRLDSIETVIPYEYGRFDFCLPEMEEQYPSENIGQVLFGERIDSSPYQFTFGQTASCVPVCKKTYIVNNDTEKLNFLRRGMLLNYQHHWIIDNMPVTWCYEVQGGSKYCSPGFPIGCYVDKAGQRKDACVIDAHYDFADHYYIFNHVNITIAYHPLDDGVNRLVSAKLEPFSIKHNTEGECIFSDKVGLYEPMSLHGKQLSDTLDISYSYSVVYVATPDVRWSSRWDYLFESMQHTNVMWFSLFNSLVLTLCLLACVIAAYKKSFKRRNFYSYCELKWRCCKKRYEKEAKEIKRWRLLSGEVFRTPTRGRTLLAVFLGTGVQLFVTGSIILVAGALGLILPPNPGALLRSTLCLYVGTGFLAGYVSMRMYRIFGGQGWVYLACTTSFLIPSLLAGIMTPLQLILWMNNSSAVLPFYAILSLLIGWLLIMTPLVFLGAFCGLKRKLTWSYDVEDMPRPIPKQPFFKRPLTGIVIGSILPFGCLFIQFFFILNSIWNHQYFLRFDMLSLAAILFVLTSGLATSVLCFFHLCSEDYRWWWRSFVTTGFTAVYFFIYCIHYFATKLMIQGVVSTILYFGYTIIMVIPFFLLSGTIGFFGCYWFILLMYGTLKTGGQFDEFSEEMKTKNTDSVAEKMDDWVVVEDLNGVVLPSDEEAIKTAVQSLEQMEEGKEMEKGKEMEGGKEMESAQEMEGAKEMEKVEETEDPERAEESLVI